MPRSCAASSASAIWRAISNVSSTGSAPWRKTIRQRLALDEFQDEGRTLTRAPTSHLFDAVDLRRCEDD